MPPLKRTLPAILAAAVLGALAWAAPALANHTQTTYFEAPNTLLNPATRTQGFATMQHLGVHALRVELSWYSVAPAPTSAGKPSFDATNPASYNWSEYDPILAEAARRHWPVLLTVTSPVPRWATSNRKAPYITRPDARDFQEFMTALARHYGPEVSLYAIWNEPNHPAFLLPQWNSNGTPASPRIYRGLWQAGYEGLQAAGIAHPQVLFGETAPTGYTTLNVRREGALHDVAPLAFLRTALCLDSHYRRSGSCSGLAIAGYSHHAYTKAVKPDWQPSGRFESDNVTIGVLSRLARALDLAARVHAIPAHTPIYLTEFGVQSLPNRQLGVAAAQQAEYDAIAERIAWSNSRVAAFSQYLLKDDPLGGAPGSSVHGGTVGFQTGLQYVNGSKKPLYYSWPVPMTVSRSGGSYSLWGLARPATGPTTVSVFVKKKGARRYTLLKTVHTNALGYWALHSGVAGVAWRVSWTSPTGETYEGPPIRAY